MELNIIGVLYVIIMSTWQIWIYDLGSLPYEAVILNWRGFISDIRKWSILSIKSDVKIVFSSKQKSLFVFVPFGFVTPPPLFEQVSYIICCRRSVAVTRPGMICIIIVLLMFFLLSCHSRTCGKYSCTSGWEWLRHVRVLLNLIFKF